MTEEMYKRISDDMLQNGTAYQRKAMNFFIKHLDDDRRFKTIKQFIDVQLNLNKVEV